MIVDTSSLIKSKEDALKTERICCFIDGSTELSIALSSGKENVLSRLYEEKSLLTKSSKNLYNQVKRDKCILEQKYETANLELDNIFSISSEHTFWALTVIFGSFRQNLAGWIYTEKPIFEMNFHIISLRCVYIGLIFEI